MICALSITPRWSDHQQASEELFWGVTAFPVWPAVREVLQLTDLHFSCVALEPQTAFDPQVPLAQSSKLRVSLAGSLSHIPHIQWVRDLLDPLSKDVQNPATSHHLHDHHPGQDVNIYLLGWTAVQLAPLLSAWLPCLSSTCQHSASQHFSPLLNTSDSGLKPTNMLKTRSSQ